MGNVRDITGDELVVRSFQRPKEQKPSRDYVGRSATTKIFYQNLEAGPQWVEYVPPALPDSRAAASSEAAAIQVYKIEELDSWNEPTGQYFPESVKIQSPFLRKELEPILKDYHVDTQDDCLIIKWPLRPLYFERHRILELSQTVEDLNTREHLNLLCEVIADELGTVIDEIDELVTKEKKITHDLLWALFPQDSLVVAPQLDCTQGCCVEESKYLNLPERSPVPRLFLLYIRRIEFDGYQYGFRYRTFQIPKFTGKKLITDLPIYPYTARENSDAFRERLVERGRRVLDFQSVHHMEYRCIPADVIELSDDKAVKKHLKSDYKERVVIDACSYIKATKCWVTKPLPGYSDIQDGVLGTLTKARANGFTIQELTERLPEVERLRNRELVLKDEKNLFIMSPMLPAFSLTTETWCHYDIKNLFEVKPNSELFDHFICDKAKLIQELVQGHQSVAKYKEAEGLLVLLSGPSGTGKTSIVEATAEKFGRPLYRPNVCDLVETDYIVAKISRIFHRATEWNAIVLLDDADFLVRDRPTHRNTDYENIVADFLRELEKFKGILFITTSYPEEIDSALASRMHAHIILPAILAQPARAQIWYDLLSQKYIYEDSNRIRNLAQWDLKARQIKNVLTIALRSPECYRRKYKAEVIENMIRATCPKAKKEEPEEYLFEPGNYVLVDGGKPSPTVTAVGTFGDYFGKM